MKKRLRKKLHRGEFRELAFPVEFRLTTELERLELDGFVDQLCDAMEARGLGFGGGGDLHWSGVVVRLGRGSVTPEDRDYVQQWLGRHDQVSEYSVGALVDAWYGDWE